MLVGDCGQFDSGDSPATVWEDGRSLVLENNITPPLVDFSHTNYAVSASLDGQVLLVGRTFQNLEVGFVLSPLVPMSGDTNCDNRVDIDDLLNVINSWGRCPECPADFDNDDDVDIDDLLIVINQWSP
jgi:hypothetical protein